MTENTSMSPPATEQDKTSAEQANNSNGTSPAPEAAAPAAASEKPAGPTIIECNEVQSLTAKLVVAHQSLSTVRNENLKLRQRNLELEARVLEIEAREQNVANQTMLREIGLQPGDQISDQLPGREGRFHIVQHPQPQQG